jgi:NADH-quinone oxidoreductase subunit M
MNWLALPWADYTVLIPLIGALVVGLTRDTAVAARITLMVTLAALVSSFGPWLALAQGVSVNPEIPRILWFSRPLFVVDGLSAPLLPLVTLLHVLTVLATSRVKANRMSFGSHLIGEAFRLAIFSCMEPWPLIGLFAVGTIPPMIELMRRGKSIRIYSVHMLAFVVLLTLGWLGVESKAAWGPAALLIAILIRSGTVPGHLWVADLFENATFGTALLYAAPIAGVYAAVRLVLPIAPEWVLQSLGIVSLITAIYSAGMAIVQTEARRFFAYIFLSHASLVLVGLELHTIVSLTGALCLWISVALSVGGLGLTLRALEARYGRLSLMEYRGLYDQSPSLAICFLLTGLGSVGFPGTLGFVAADLLIDGAVGANLWVGVGLLVAGAINGIAVVRAYLFLFTGTRHQSTIHLSITARERFAVLTLAALILGGGLIPQYGVNDRYQAAEDILKKRTKTVPGLEPAPSH